MNNTLLRFSLGLAALAGSTFAGSALAQNTYEIDGAHSSAHFSVRHLMISNVKGDFTKVTGSFSFDPKNVAASKIDATIDAASISTGNVKRDGHLKTADFFDVEKYPTLTFKSKGASKSGDKIQVKGDLTMHGVTKEVVLDVDGPTPELVQQGGARVGATATTKINRKDWGLTWNRALEAGGVTVSDEVTITLDIEGVRKIAKAN